MKTTPAGRREAWRSLAIFMLVLIALSAIAHFAIVRLNPTSIYVGALMWCPSLAAFITLSFTGRRLVTLPWKWASWSNSWRAYAVPVAYTAIAYTAVWTLGFGGVPDHEQIAEWSAELGIAPDATILSAVLMIALLATIQLIKSLGTIAGEEIGWRGFFIWELRKVTSFEGVALVSGLVWAAWHYPIIIAYGGGDTLFQIACFTLMIISMSVILAYYTFRSNSLSPAVLFHAAHNIYIQKIFTPLTTETGKTALWIDEYGLMVPLTATLFALYYWRKARGEGL